MSTSSVADKVQAAMAERQLDALLCYSFPNICYLTGIESVLWYKYFLAVVPCAGSPILLAQDFEMPNALIRSWVEDRVTYRLDEDPVRATVKLLAERGLAGKRLGDRDPSLGSLGSHLSPAQGGFAAGDLGRCQ